MATPPPPAPPPPAAAASAPSNSNHSHVARATYPIPHPVACLLQVAILGNDPSPPSIAPPAVGGASVASAGSAAAAALTVQVENLEQAVSLLLENSVDALDRLYFSTSPALRKRRSFSRRLQLRIATDRARRTLTLTDLGVGMTRADLINSLGIGRTSHVARRWYQQCSLTHPAAVDQPSQEHQQHPTKTPANNNNNHGPTGSVNEEEHVSESEQQDDDDDDDEDDTNRNDDDEEDEKGVSDSANYSSVNNTPATSEEDEDEDEEVVGEVSDTEEDEEGAGDDEDNNDSTMEDSVSTSGDGVPCRSSDLGGFYAALAALGMGVQVGTKAKDDDYYEFSVGMTDEWLANRTTTTYDDKRRLLQEFRIIRPFPEGTSLKDCWTSLDATKQFVQVHGESGTRVTVFLNEPAVAAGLLDEGVLQPMITKILESKTQYTVAFSQTADPASWMMVDDEEEKNNEDDVDTMVDANNNNNNQDDREVVESMETTTISNEDKDNNDDSRAVARLYNSVKERAKYIPLRLSLGERKMLRLVEAAMTCCEYTTSVDKPFSSPARRTHAQLKGVTSILLGLVTACDFAAGQALSQGDEQYVDYQVFFRQMFEIARRHKIMNPEKMRTEYGKLIYLLQDAVSPSVMPHLSFLVKGPIETVYKFLEDRNGLALLSDKLIETATEEILAGKKKRSVIQMEIKRKERAVVTLKQKYRTTRLSADDIHLCLYSICDNNSFINSNRVPVDKVIEALQTYFSPDKIEEGYSLSIVSGIEGSRLSHNHERQYYFVLQSLTLWRDIIDDMFRLWAMAEEDLLSESITYSLQDTGQGMQRVQQSPRTYKAMQQILLRVQAKVKHWVGSSVIHMGDHNVPNALSFIDKYTQVPRILGPIVSCLENLERICEEDNGIKDMVETGFGGFEKLRKDILFDFFKSAFDGSGGDTFYDAGSCIDGRLTSAWNWCSQLPDKPFYPIFKLTGFTGFDGEFKSD